MAACQTKHQAGSGSVLAAACEGQHGQRAGLGATRMLGIARLARQALATAGCWRVRKRSRRTMEAIQKRLTKATGVIQ
jgi:hypothetical protein